MLKNALGWLFALSLGYVAPALILLGGVFGLWTGSEYLVDAYRSVNWPQTTGTVIRSELASESRFEKSNHTTTSYWAEVEYEYDVDGESFVSQNVTLDGLRYGPHIGEGKSQAEEVLSRYPVNAEVSVYYDPHAPTRATLEAGVSVGNFFVPIFSVVLTLLGAVWLGAMLFSRPGENEIWAGRERPCPKCQTMFTSVQDRGTCPNCRHVFYASG